MNLYTKSYYENITSLIHECLLDILTPVLYYRIYLYRNKDGIQTIKIQNYPPNYPLFFVFLNVLRFNFTVLRPTLKKNIGIPIQVGPYKVGSG